MMKNFSEEIYDEVQNRTVKYARYNQMMEEMDHIYRLAADYQRAEGMMIMGPSGSGKTRLLERFAEKHPDERKETHMHRPVVMITMPPKPTEMALLYRLTLAFGEQYTTGRSYQLLGRAQKLLRQCETHLLIIDEGQHMVRENNQKDASLAADTIKVIMDETKVGVIVSGIPEVEDILLANKQIRGRFTDVKMCDPWIVVNETLDSESSDINMEHLQEFSSILSALVTISNYSGDSSLFLQPDVIRRIYFATDGRIRYMSRLVAAVLATAIPTEAPKIELSHLHEAFTAKIYRRSKPESNPFDEAFVERRLILSGEPFWGDVE